MNDFAAFRLEAVGAAYVPHRSVLTDVTLSLDAGRVIALLGENGSGKSSLLRVLAGLLRPRAGRVLHGGRPLEEIPRRERALSLGYLPQTFEPFFPATARELVLLGRTPRLGPFGLPSRADHAAADAALAETDAAALAGSEIHEMSGGERQRVLLARVLAGDPRALLLDEPTANLDPRHRFLVGAALRRRAARGATVVFSTHELDLASAAADDAVLLRGGRVLAAGPLAETLTSELLSTLFDVGACVTPVPGGRPVVSLGPGAPSRTPEASGGGASRAGR